ncbi:Uncharacterised protein [Shewanella baltica]|nr:Uncharacterised protein [Shewanella baltica]
MSVLICLRRGLGQSCGSKDELKRIIKLEIKQNPNQGVLDLGLRWDQLFLFRCSRSVIDTRGQKAVIENKLQREDHAGDCRTHQVSEYASGNGAKTITGDKFAALWHHATQSTDQNCHG